MSINATRYSPRSGTPPPTPKPEEMRNSKEVNLVLSQIKSERGINAIETGSDTVKTILQAHATLLEQQTLETDQKNSIALARQSADDKRDSLKQNIAIAHRQESLEDALFFHKNRI